MKKLTSIQLKDGTVIYMEVQEDIELVSEDTKQDEPTEESIRVIKGPARQTKSPQEKIKQSFQDIEATIRTYTNNTLDAFRKLGNDNIDKVTLEFGIKVGGKAGIPYITEGSADSHLKIVVECSFPKQEK